MIKYVFWLARGEMALLNFPSVLRAVCSVWLLLGTAGSKHVCPSSLLSHCPVCVTSGAFLGT